MLNFSDKVSTSAVRKTADGYLVADAAVARTGIQNYLGSEVGKPEMPIVRVYRPAEQVFSKDAMKTYAHRPMTNDHPSVAVNAENWKDYAVGQTGGDVMRDGEFVRVPLVLMDQKAISDWENGKVELSMGYSADIVFQKGVTDSGEEYDAIQTNLHMNHLALVDKARGGDKLRIGDQGKPDIISPATKGNDALVSSTLSHGDTERQAVSRFDIAGDDGGREHGGLCARNARREGCGVISLDSGHIKPPSSGSEQPRKRHSRYR